MGLLACEGIDAIWPLADSDGELIKLLGRGVYTKWIAL